MTDDPQHPRGALRDLVARWEERAREAADQARRVGVDKMHQSYFFRGVAEAYKAALDDLRAALGTEIEAGSAEQPASPVVEQPETAYAVVSRELAQAFLKRAGLTVVDLYTHKDDTFSAVFSPLTAMPFDERIGRMTRTADVIILDYGRLPNTNKTFIDFGFRSAPEL